MQSILHGERLSKITSFNGIDVYHIMMDKFKTNTINFFFCDNITRESASLNAMIPAVLRRGCEGFPTFRDIALYLESLYGAVFDCGVTKKGELQIIQFYIEFVSDRYTGKASNIFEKSFELLEKVVTKPVLDNGVFKQEYVDQEKENLKNLIEARVNDKLQYAVEKCYEEMCKDEPFGIHEYGFIDELKKIDANSLYKQYEYMLETLPLTVFITGNIDEESIGKIIERLKNIKRKNVKSINASIINKMVNQVKHVTEKMNINQGKLSMGFRTETAPDSKDYYPLLVYNGILGGGVHSKLFQNVREKASLAYYAFSRLEKFKGLMVISSGIEVDNKDRAVDIIQKQLDEIKAGNVSDYEYESTIKAIETGVNSLKDNQMHIVDFFLSQLLVGTTENLDTIVQKVKQVTKKDVIDVSNKVKLDTVYFLTTK